MHAAFEKVMATSPRGKTASRDVLVTCIEACSGCELACLACMDACLGEANLDMLRACIKLNASCADVCATTARLLTRSAEGMGPLLRSQLEACVQACVACKVECDKHRGHHEHCAACADMCGRCEDACRKLLATMPAAS
jgi:hypothetical protein